MKCCIAKNGIPMFILFMALEQCKRRVNTLENYLRADSYRCRPDLLRTTRYSKSVITLYPLMAYTW